MAEESTSYESATKLDGWQSLLSSYGTRRDPSEAITPQHDRELQREQVEAVYRADGIGRRIVDLPAEEMTREWVSIQGDGGEERQQDLSDLQAKQRFNKALRWAGLYGGAVMVMLIDDGVADLDQPLNENAIRGVNDLIVYDRWQTSWTQQHISDDPSSRWFGRAEWLHIHPLYGMPYTVHRSRLLIFDGEDVPDRLRQQNNGWGDSRLQPVFRALGRYGEAMGGTSSIIRDFILPVLSMKNLSDMIASGQEDVIRKRLEILGVSRSMLNVLLIDADEEGYEKKASAVSGIDKLLQELKHNLSACAGIPQTKLFGRAPEGQNATGESDARNWYDQVAGEQEDKLLPNVRELVRLLDLADGGEPEDRVIECAPLWQESAGEQATTLKTYGEGLTMLVDWGLVTDDAARDILSGAGYATGFEQ